MFKIGSLELKSRLLLGTGNLTMKTFKPKRLKRQKQMS